MFSKIAILLVIAAVLGAGCTSVTPPAKGTLQFSSSPSGAQIYLDNQFQGTTPCTVAGVDAGTHILEFRYSGLPELAFHDRGAPGSHLPTLEP